MTSASEISTTECLITQKAFNFVKDTQGKYFQEIQGLDPNKFAADTLNPIKSIQAASILERSTSLIGKRVLEIGAGCGVTHITWTNKYKINGYAIEPEGEGFDKSATIARSLLEANGISGTNIISAKGENLPFKNNEFDIVYSSNVLEHVQDPNKVLHEAVRVAKPKGIIHFVCPNYLSYFDGHYAAFHPPILSNRFFCWWIKFIYRKNPEFAQTIRTEINPIWARRQLEQINKKMPINTLSLGDDIFKERMRETKIDGWMRLDKLQKLVRTASILKLNNLGARIIVLLNGWTPLIITLEKV